LQKQTAFPTIHRVHTATLSWLQRANAGGLCKEGTFGLNEQMCLTCEERSRRREKCDLQGGTKVRTVKKVHFGKQKHVHFCNALELHQKKG
jgi:hypothetical protein